MMHRLLTFSMLLAFTSPALAQYNLGFQQAPDAITFDVDGSIKTFGGIGGYTTPQLSMIDLDLDGTDDLFVFDRDNDVVRTYIYNSSTEDYDYAPRYESAFPDDLKEFALLRDYDCDGHADIFTYHLAGYRVYRNNGTAPLGFTKVTDKIRSDYGSITTGAFVLAGDVPAIVDVDMDGDLDLLTFGTVNSENTIEYHRNLSQDLYNSCDSLEFEVVTQCWGNVEEPFNASELIPISCKGVVPPSGGREQIHPGSSLLLFDADNDNDLDLVIGDIQTDHVIFAINTGDASSANIDVNQQTQDFPNATDPVHMQYLVSGYHLDIDHDGKRDLVMTVNNTVDSSVNVEHLWYYRNVGSTVPSFDLETKEFLLDRMLDLGSNTSIETIDYNGDGDLDLLISNDYRRDPDGSTLSRIYYFERLANGTYQLEDDDVGGLSGFGLKSITMTLGDIDDDGDQDLLLGDLNGNLHLFTNAPSGGVASFSLTAPVYQGISSIGANAAPEWADVNGDGLLDLLVGERIGTVSYFENTGTSTQASYASSPTIDDIGGIDVSVACCVGHAHPVWNDDPSLAYGPHLMVGSDERQAIFYAVPQDLNATFALVDSLAINAGQLSPRFVDLDGDGVSECIAGTAEGGVKFLERDEDVLIGLPEALNSSNALHLSIYPNPGKDVMHIASDVPLTGEIHIRSVDGRSFVSLGAIHEQTLSIDVRSLPSGIFFLTFIGTDGSRKSERFTILR